MDDWDNRTDGFIQQFGTGLGAMADAMREETDREILASMPGEPSVVDELAWLAKWPHLPPVLRRIAGGSIFYDEEEFHNAIDDAVLRGPRQPEIAQADIDAEIATALTRAANGERSPDLHDRVRDLLIERDAFDPTKLPEIELNITSVSITAKPRRLGVWPPPLPEPSVVDRLAAVEDHKAAERVAKMDKAIARRNGSADDLRLLFADEDDDDWEP